MMSLLLFLAASAVLVSAQTPERCSKLVAMAYNDRSINLTLFSSCYSYSTLVACSCIQGKTLLNICLIGLANFMNSHNIGSSRGFCLHRLP